ncbi:hypothetical protein F8M49_29910 [Rhodococcus zopfii]|uniref:Uncharacterized protein n=1 Tax=Rhodococcus zopfii TaxID=43772 RepID=A0ABU3WXD3_9NOCA|nr:hypothetical protein [Rhodococcus zopfii]MDV2478578.1 hypothetical protein [Rhodococcus zopfii]
MANPAELLADRFQRWVDLIDSPWDSANDEVPPYIKVECVNGFDLLSQIGTFLADAKATGSDVDVYIEELPHWAECISRVLIGTAHTQTLKQGRRMLRALAGVMAAPGAQISEEDRAELGEAIDDLLAELRQDESLPPEMRAYLLNIATHARTAIDEFEVLGSFNLRGAVDRLVAATAYAAASEAASGSDRLKWRTFFGRILGFGGGVASAIAVESATQLLLGS